MFQVSDCTSLEYHLLRMMGRHRKNLTHTVLKAIEEEGTIEWEDHSYSSICDAGELLHPTFGFIKRLSPEHDVKFKDYYAEHPTKKPLKSIWDGIGKASSGSIVLMSLKSEKDIVNAQMDTERMDAVAYLVKKGIPVKYVDLILIEDSCFNPEYDRTIKACRKLWDHGTKPLHPELKGTNIFHCFMGLDGHDSDIEDSEV